MNENVEELKIKYPKDTKIKLIEMYETQPVPAGPIGKVDFVDDIGTIHMIWENGSSLGLVEGVDEFEVLKE